MHQPLISIAILCYNGGDTIVRALECALAQDWGNKEVIVVDDGSADQSVDIVERLAAKDSRVRLIKHTHNKGRPAARNTAIANFNGDYLAFFDDDDWSHPSRVSAQYKRLIDFHNQFALCFCHLEEVSPDGRSLNRIRKSIGWETPEPCGEIVAKYFLTREKDSKHHWGAIGTGAFMAHRSTIERIGYFDVSMLRSEDVEYTIRAALLGAYFIGVDKALVKYYKINSDDKYALMQMESQLCLASKYKKYISLYHFLMRTAKPPIRKVLKDEMRVKDYFRIIWKVIKMSPRAGLILFCRPKNILRLLRIPFVKMIK